MREDMLYLGIMQIKSNKLDDNFIIKAITIMYLFPSGDDLHRVRTRRPQMTCDNPRSSSFKALASSGLVILVITTMKIGLVVANSLMQVSHVVSHT